MDLLLKDKRVLVTGSTRGIGRAIGEAFAAEGAAVAFTGRSESSLTDVQQKLSKHGDRLANKHLFLRCDFERASEIELLAATIDERWHGIDVLVCNVGSGKSVPDAIPDAEKFQSGMSLNFGSAVNAAREFLPRLIRARGNIVFISSIAGVEAIGAPVDYSVAKTALLSFAKNLSRKVGKDCVRVNTVAPGNIYFEGGTWDQKLKADPERVEAMLASSVPLRRFGTPSEVAAACLFFASPVASFATGSVLVIDGGQSTHLF